MKTVIYSFLSITLLLFGCNDGFLDHTPPSDLTLTNYFKTDNDFRTYSLGLYDFEGYGVGISYNISITTDEMTRGNQVQDERIFDRRVIPASGGAWSWSKLRAINIMIREAQNANLSVEEKLHWEGVGRLFRAREYFAKVKLFGDVPWVGEELNIDSEILYATQDPRSMVMDQVLNDLNFAVQHIRENDGSNLINRYVALAIKSEVCLFEGTFRKYHTELNLQESAEEWLRECVSASEAIMNSGKFSLSSEYRTIYSSLNLANNSEVILYKQYEAGLIINIRSRIMGLPHYYGPTKDALESYLCIDGLPFGVSPLHPKAIAGEPETPIEEFVNRDPRMGMSVVIPYDEGQQIPNSPALVSTATRSLPKFGTAVTGEDGIPSPTGYNLYKWWNPDSPWDDVNGILDAPLYSLNTILLNFAEAKEELGECDDVVLDKSINLLRQRVDMPKLTVAIANSINDPKKALDAPGISTLLWEIRRERRVELMFEGTRFDDILRWKKASYFGKPFVGAYIDLDNRPPSAYRSDGTNMAKVTLGDRNGNPLPEDARKGYVLPYIERQPRWTDDDLKVYYTPIDVKSLTLNTKLQQVPGW